jgi:hypothetical protein
MKLLRLLLIAVLILMPLPASADQGLTALTNNIRTNAGLTALQPSAILDQIALKRAHEISENFAHRSINPEIDANFSCWEEWGGIIEWAKPISDVTDQILVQRWYESPEHRVIMLGNYDLIGSATYVQASTNTVWAVEIFLRTCDNSGNTTHKSTSTPTPSRAPQTTQPLLPNTSTLVGTQN